METVKYGSRDWIESQYARSKDDPWGLDWRPSQKFRYIRMFDALRDKVATMPRPLSIIDIGCATGAFTAMLGGLNGESGVDGDGAVIGVDIADAAVARATARFPHIRFERSALDEYSLRHSGTADIVTCMEVLYYLPKEKRVEAVGHLRQMLKPGGCVLVSSMIATPPYFSLTELESLLAAELSIVDTGVLYLKPLVLREKLLMKLRGRRAGDRVAEFDQARIDRWERWSSRLFGRYARSHAFVIALKA